MVRSLFKPRLFPTTAGTEAQFDELRPGDIVTVYWLDHCAHDDTSRTDPAPLFLFDETREIDKVYHDRIVCIGRRVHEPSVDEKNWRKDVYVKAAVTRVIRWGNHNGEDN